MPSQDAVWKHILTELGRDNSQTVMRTWFDDASILKMTEDRLVIYTPPGFKRDILQGRYAPLIREILKRYLNTDYVIEVLSENELDEFLKENGPPAQTPDRNEFVFDRFVVGASNKFAHAASLAVAESPGRLYNPLFLYGGSGLGKTHLLYAILNHVSKEHPNYSCLYISAEQFTHELVAAIRTGKNHEFHEKYRRANLLLVDDIQFIAGKDFSQEEFFHTFNTLYESGHQLVMTADRPPKELNRIEDRLLSRFGWGLVTDLQPPDFETRMAIVKVKAFRLGLHMPNEVAEYIASSVTGNVRLLEGSVKKLMAYRDLLHGDIQLEAAKRALNDLIRENPGVAPTPKLIIGEVCDFMGFTREEILGSNRRAELVEARQVAMYLCRRMTDLSLSDLGKSFNRDHTTVLHAFERIEERQEQSQQLRDSLATMMENIKNK